MENNFKNLQIGFIAGNQLETAEAFKLFIENNEDIIKDIIKDKKSIKKIILKDGTTISDFHFLISKNITCDVKLDQVLIYEHTYRVLDNLYYRYNIQDFLENSNVPLDYRIFKCSIEREY